MSNSNLSKQQNTPHKCGADVAPTEGAISSDGSPSASNEAPSLISKELTLQQQVISFMSEALNNGFWSRTRTQDLVRAMIDANWQQPSSVETIGSYDGKDICLFLGWLSVELPELHRIETSRLLAAWDKWRERYSLEEKSETFRRGIDRIRPELREIERQGNCEHDWSVASTCLNGCGALKASARCISCGNEPCACPTSAQFGRDD